MPKMKISNQISHFYSCMTFVKNLRSWFLYIGCSSSGGKCYKLCFVLCDYRKTRTILNSGWRALLERMKSFLMQILRDLPQGMLYQGHHFFPNNFATEIEKPALEQESCKTPYTGNGEGPGQNYIRC